MPIEHPISYCRTFGRSARPTTGLTLALPEPDASARPTTGLTLALPEPDASLPNNQARGIGIVSFMPTALAPKTHSAHLRDARG
jgi:hypothetical protein